MKHLLLIVLMAVRKEWPVSYDASQPDAKEKSGRKG